jgi:hypothetical protein
MTSHKPPYRCLLAGKADTPEILRILVEVAPEIPVRVDTCRRKRLLFKRIQIASFYRSVWIARDRDNRIVGFLMAESDGQTLDLSYGSVRPGPHRGKHIFTKLMKRVKAKGVPLTATVLRLNKSNMLSRLLKLEFTKDDPLLNDRDILRWQPEPAEAAT